MELNNSILELDFPEHVFLMTAKTDHFALCQSTLPSVGFVVFPGDELGSEALNMLLF